jgi:hypothetical protein
MQTKQLVDSIEASENDSDHEKAVTDRFREFARELDERLPAGQQREQCLIRLQEAWLWAKEGAAIDAS